MREGMETAVAIALPPANALESRVGCKNAAVCRQSIVAPAALMLPSYAARGVCVNCDVSGGHALDIVASTDECPVCYEPMELGVKWNANSCVHRFCPACFHQMMWGAPRPPYEKVDVYRGDGYNGGWRVVLVHDDGRAESEDEDVEDEDVESPIPDDVEDSDDDAPFGERETCPICARPRF